LYEKTVPFKSESKWTKNYSARPNARIEGKIEAMLLRRRGFRRRIRQSQQIEIQPMVQSEEITAWEASKRGDMLTTLAIIDGGDATPNDVE
jgi:hypothetical protein